MNQKIRELARAAGLPVMNIQYGDSDVDTDMLEDFARAIVQELVSKMEVAGEDFYFNESNNYGSVAVKFYVAGDPWETMRGTECLGEFRDGVRGNGYYHLNERFTDYLMENFK